MAENNASFRLFCVNEKNFPMREFTSPNASCHHSSSIIPSVQLLPTPLLYNMLPLLIRVILELLEVRIYRIHTT